MMLNEMHCLTVSEWKSVQKRLDDLENIVKELKSKSFGNENQNFNSNLETRNSFGTELVELNSQSNSISPGSDVDVVVTNLPVPGPSSSIDQLTLTSEGNTSGLGSATTISSIITNASARTSVLVTQKKDSHSRAPSSSTSSFCFSKNMIGIHDQNAFEKSRRAVISLKRCDETVVPTGKPSFGSKHAQNKKNGSTTNNVKCTRPPNLLRKAAATSSHKKRNGKCNASAVPVGVKQKRYQCLICSRKCATKQHMTNHTRVHTGERPFTCHVCGKVFRYKNSLTVHLRRHTGEKRFACQLCSKAFFVNYDLKNHLKVHTGEKPFCSRCFSQRSNLTMHINLHTGEKPYNCQYCPRTFGRRAHLNLHLRAHTRGRPFVCSFCKMSFSFRAALKRHFALHTTRK